MQLQSNSGADELLGIVGWYSNIIQQRRQKPVEPDSSSAVELEHLPGHLVSRNSKPKFVSQRVPPAARPVEQLDAAEDGLAPAAGGAKRPASATEGGILRVGMLDRSPHRNRFAILRSCADLLCGARPTSPGNEARPVKPLGNPELGRQIAANRFNWEFHTSTPMPTG
jgi:hypothetical protein